VCIYISRVLLLISPTAEVHENLELLVSEIINHLSFVTSSSELFKATSWPAFVAGADAKDLEQQAWAMARLHELWECLPCTMGYVRSAMEILGGIWNKRDAAVCGSTDTVNWIQDLKASEIDFMIA
jgi:Fungal specific transcription factor domain